MSEDVVIAGAGIGGLTLAIALGRAGVAATVVEQAPRLLPIGAGLSVQPNAVRALRAVGLDSAVREVSRSPRRASILRPSGAALHVIDLEDMEARFGAPMLTVHRGALQRVLLAATDPKTIQLGRRVEGFEVREGGVRALLASGASREGRFLVGADGIRSAVRESLHGSEPFRYAGSTCWRGVTPEHVRGAADDVSETWGTRRRFGVVPLVEGTYWFATETAPLGGVDAGDPRDHLLALFGDWHDPVRRCIEGTPPHAILRTDLYDRPPRRDWGLGPVTLLGDAAHPATPNLGQGACLAIEDAVSLAKRLSHGTVGDDTLRGYEAERGPRTARFVNASWRYGRLSQPRSGLASRVRDLGLRWTPAWSIRRRMRWMYEGGPT